MSDTMEKSGNDLAGRVGPARPIRLLYCCADRGVSPFGDAGSAVHIRCFLEALAARGAEVTAVFPEAVLRVGSGDPSGETLSSGTESGVTLAGVRLVFVPEDPVTERAHREAVRFAVPAEPPGVVTAGSGDSDARAQGPDGRIDSGSAAAESPVGEVLAGQRQRLSDLHGLQQADGLLAGAGLDFSDFDAVCERYSLWSLAGLRAARAANLPFLMEVNAPLVDQQLKYRSVDLVATARGIETTLFREADRVLAMTEGLEHYAHELGTSRRRIRRLPCGASGKLLEADHAERRRRSRDEPLVVGFLGTLKPWHGLETLLQALRRLRKAGETGFELEIIGDGPMRGEVDRMIHDFKLQNSTRMHGRVPHHEVPALLSRWHVGVAPYPPMESFYFSPLKIWEYAASGVAIAASESGELPKLFPHRSAALLHQPGSAKKLAAHLRQFRDDPGLAPRLARRARVVARRHSWDRIAARFLRIVESQCSGTGDERVVHGEPD